MLLLDQPTGIEALNKHLEQVVSPPWKLKNWFLSDDDWFKEAQKAIREDKSIEAYLNSHYDKFTLTFELSRAENLLDKFHFPEYLSEVGSLIIGIIVGLAYLVCSVIVPNAVLIGLIIAMISFIGCDIIIYQRRKLKRAILILESCLISLKLSEK